MSAFSYKRTTTTAMKAVGSLDVENMTIEIDGDVKKLSTLLSEFNGCEIELDVKVKDTEEFDEPYSID